MITAKRQGYAYILSGAVSFPFMQIPSLPAVFRTGGFTRGVLFGILPPSETAWNGQIPVTIQRTGRPLNCNKWMKLISEGVETAEQLKILRQLGCSYFQGFYFSTPLAVKDFEEKYL